MYPNQILSRIATWSLHIQGHHSRNATKECILIYRWAFAELNNEIFTTSNVKKIPLYYWKHNP